MKIERFFSGVTRGWLRVSASWNHIWHRQVPPQSLAIFRIFFGFFLLLRYGVEWPHAWLLYSEQAIMPPLVSGSHWWSLVLTLPPPVVAQFIFTVFLFSILSFAVGYRTRVSLAVCVLLQLYYWNLSIWVFGTSYERLFLTITILLLVLADPGATFSLDARRLHGSWRAWRYISILPQQLLAVQITATYWGVGWQKMVLPAWQSGEILAWGFMGRWATDYAWWVARLNWPLWVYDRLVDTVKLFEFMLPFGLWFRKTQPWFFVGGFLFHTGITIFLNIWWFQILIPAYIVFLDPAMIHAWCVQKLGVPERPVLGS